MYALILIPLFRDKVDTYTENILHFLQNMIHQYFPLKKVPQTKKEPVK